jgi:integrase/recombinase XerD
MSVEWGGHVNSPAPRKRPGHGTREASPGCTPTLQALADAARLVRDAMRDKTYRATPLGLEIGRYIRWKRSEWGAAENTMLVYEQVLSKLALHHADLELIDFAPPMGTERVRDFLGHYWGDAKPSTRARNLAVVRDFFRWAVRERGLIGDPTVPIASPRQRGTERRAHTQDVVRRLVLAQDDRRDQIALRLLAQLGLRKNELRLIQYRHIDLAHATVTVFGKGGTVLAVPLVWADLRLDIERLTLERGAQPDHFLLYPKQHPERPLDPASLHRWWTRCLDRADLPRFPMHECRHTAITEFLRQTGNLKLAQMLARHKSIRTTADIYGHLELADLAAALREMPSLFGGK